MESRSKFIRFIPWLLILVGAGLLVTSAIWSINHVHAVVPKISAGAPDSTPPPSSAKLIPEQIASYNVPPTNPKYVTIPAIGISNVPILKLGLLPSGTIATPNNIYEAGWFNASSLPGQPGAMFIYGHVSSWEANGIFYNLKKLVPGDKLTITRGDNQTYTYQVVSSKVYPYDQVDMQQVLSPINSQKPGLNLMTCTGKLIKNTSEFSERLVIFTSLVNA